MSTPADKLNPSDFARRIREKHPSVYDDVPDDVLTDRVLSKYPDYKSAVKLPDFDAPVTNEWGAKRSYGGHTGVDVGYGRGERVGVPLPGRVTFAGERAGYGNRVEVDHGNGIVTTYSHLDGFDVNEGDEITPDRSLGRVGNSGGDYRPHLHFEVLRDGQKVNAADTPYRPRRITSSPATPVSSVTPVSPEAGAALPAIAQATQTPAGAAPPPLNYADESQERPEDFADLTPKPVPAPSVYTPEGRELRRRKVAAEKEGGALYRIPVGTGRPEEAAQAGVNYLAKETDATPEFVAGWLKRNNLGLQFGEQQSAPTGYAVIPTEAVGRLRKDYRASLSLPKRAVANVREIAATHSPGEVLVGVGGEAASGAMRGMDIGTRPLQAASGAFWAKIRGADNADAVKTAVQEFYGEDPELAKNVIAEALRNSETLKGINPRLPALLGQAAELVFDPTNLIPAGLVARGVSRVGKVAKQGGRLARVAGELRDLGVFVPDVPKEAFKATGAPEVLGDLTRRADRVNVPDVADEAVNAGFTSPRVVKRSESPSVESATPEAALVEKPTVAGQQATATPVAGVAAKRPAVWQHRDFGRVVEHPNQSGVTEGKVRVTDGDGRNHVIQRVNGRGAGNQIAVPVKESDAGTSARGEQQFGDVRGAQAGRVPDTQGAGSVETPPAPMGARAERLPDGAPVTSSAGVPAPAGVASPAGRLDAPAAGYRAFQSGQTSTAQTFSAEGGSSILDSLGSKPARLEGDSQGSVVVFAEGDAGWAYPNTRLRYREEALRKVFPGLTESQFDAVKAGGEFAPVRVVKNGEGRWEVAPEVGAPAPTVPRSAAPIPKGADFGKGLTRSYRAGMNQAEIKFASQEQRDLYDYAANIAPARSSGRNPRAQSAGFADLERRVTNLYADKGELLKAAFGVRDDVRAQMRGVKDGEVRAVVDNVRKAETPAPASARPAAPVPDAPAFRERIKSTFNLSDEQADAVTEIAEARARAWGKERGREPSDYYAERFGGIVRGGQAGPGALNQAARKGDEQPRNLVVAHNLSERNLLFADRMGGLAMPSIAITKKDAGFEGFGEITLLADKSLIDPKVKSNRVVDADMYSPRYPSVKYEINGRVMEGTWKDVTATWDSKYGKDALPDWQRSAAYDWRHVAENIADDGPRYLENNKLVMAQFLKEKGIELPDTPSELDRVIRERDLYHELGTYAQEMVDAATSRQKFFKGYTNSGNRRYADYNLENVLREMKSQMKEGEGFNYGAGTIRSKAAKRYRSIEQIQKDRGRIVTADEMKAAKEEMQNRLVQLAEEVAPNYKYDRGSFGYLDQFANALAEGAQRGNLRRALEEYGFEGVDIAPIQKYIDDLRALPTEYFEAKPQRGVGLQEFAVAVVPDNISARARQVLERKGLEVVTYKAGDKAARKAAIEAATQAKPDLLFQQNKAAVEFMADGRAVLRAFQKADVSSAVHELAHVFRRDLSPELLKDAEDALGVKGKWENAHEEQFARGFERYLKTGSAPSEKLRRVYARFKDWLTEIYGAVRGKAHPLKYKPNERLVAVFDRMLDAAPKGEYGQFTNALHKAPSDGTPAFFENAQVKRALGLKPDASTEDVRWKLAAEVGKPRVSHVTPEDAIKWADSKNLQGAAREALDSAVEKYRATVKAPTEYQQTGIRRRNVDPTTQSLAEFVRASGGIRVDRDLANRGELSYLTNKESGTSGLVRKDGVSVHEMARMAAEEGYPVATGGGYYTDKGFMERAAGSGEPDAEALIEALSRDLQGEKVYSHQREVDYETLYRQQHPEDNTDALDSFLSNEENGILFDKVQDGTATRREVEDFRRAAGEAGLFPEYVRTVVAQGKRAQAEGVQAPLRDEAATDFDFRDDSLDADQPAWLYQSDHNPQQLGFTNEGLVQESSRAAQPKPKLDNAQASAAKRALGSEAYARLSSLKDSPVARFAVEVERRVNPSNSQNAPDVMAALSKLAELKRTKQTVDDYLNQGSLFGGRELTPAQERILSALDKNPRKVIDEAFPAEAQPQQDVLFQADHSTAARRQRAYKALLEAKGQGSLSPDLRRNPSTRTRMGANRSVDPNQPTLTSDLATPKAKPTFKEQLADVANAPRSLKSSVDLSAAMRQGAMFTLTHPFRATRIFFGQQLKSLSNRGYESFVADLKADPDIKTMKDSGLHLTSLADEGIGNREEAFASKFVGKLPIVGGRIGLVTRSEHAYVTFLDAARSQWFKQLKAQADDAAKKAGKAVTKEQYETIAKFVNRATGRGDLGRGAINDAAPLLNSVFFAPRYAVSKVQVFDPRMYAQLPPGARKMALRQAAQYFATVGATALMLKYGFGAEVGLDPEESDFLKVRVGNTRYDLAAGQGQYVTLAARLLREADNNRKGEDTKVGRILDRFTRYKYAPVPAAMRNTWEGKDAIGKKTSLGREALNLVTPIYLTDLYEAFQQEGAAGLLKNAPGFVGVGVQTYEDRPKDGGGPLRRRSNPNTLRRREASR